MALTDNPYLPLYIIDWLTSNKLKMCTAISHGVLINIMCLMHRENEYGKIFLNQKFKQTDKQVCNFALQLAKLCALEYPEILIGLTELIEEDILIIDGDYLIQERMVNDAELNLKRREFGNDVDRKKAPKKTDKIKVLIMPFDSESFCNMWQTWKDYKKSTFRFSYKTTESEQSALASLVKLVGGSESEAMDHITYAMSRQWQHFFPIPKQFNNGFNNKPATGSAVDNASAFAKLSRFNN